MDKQYTYNLYYPIKFYMFFVSDYACYKVYFMFCIFMHNDKFLSMRIN